jgi:hypothetical protein
MPLCRPTIFDAPPSSQSVRERDGRKSRPDRFAAVKRSVCGDPYNDRIASGSQRLARPGTRVGVPGLLLPAYDLIADL